MNGLVYYNTKPVDLYGLLQSFLKELQIGNNKNNNKVK